MSLAHRGVIAAAILAAAWAMPLTMPGSATAAAPAQPPGKTNAPAPPPAAPAPTKSAAPSPLPAAATVASAPIDAAKANEIFQSLYGVEIKRITATHDGPGAVALAARLLEAARPADVQPVMAALLCEKACELGLMDTRGYGTVLAAADLLIRKAPAKADVAHDAMLTVRQRQYEAAVMPAARTRTATTYADLLVSTADAKVKAGEFDDAVKMYRQAGAVVRTNHLPSAAIIDAREKRALELQKLYARLTMLTNQVNADPANAAARDRLVQLLLVDFDNPAEAAVFIDATSDPALRKYVPAATKGVDAAPELACIEMADWYRGLAAGSTIQVSKAAMLLRARAYYQRFLSLHHAEDLDHTKAELALKVAEADLVKLGVTPPAGPAVASASGTSVARAAPLPMPPSGILILPCDAAEIHGTNLRVERRYKDGPSLGYWSNAADWASWIVQFSGPGTYEMSALCASPGGAVEVAAEIAGQKNVVKAHPTATFGELVPLVLGSFTVKQAGDAVVKISPNNPAAWQGINLVTVRLRRIN